MIYEEPSDELGLLNEAIDLLKRLVTYEQQSSHIPNIITLRDLSHKAQRIIHEYKDKELYNK